MKNGYRARDHLLGADVTPLGHEMCFVVHICANVTSGVGRRRQANGGPDDRSDRTKNGRTINQIQLVLSAVYSRILSTSFWTIGKKHSCTDFRNRVTASCFVWFQYGILQDHEG